MTKTKSTSFQGFRVRGFGGIREIKIGQKFFFIKKKHIYYFRLGKVKIKKALK